MKRFLSAAEIFIIIVIAILPVFASFPYRINIFLSWEGAYRLSAGQLPYRDFGIPVGFMYWVIPAVFFNVFGAYLVTLIKAQAFINLLAGFAFRSLFKSARIPVSIRFLGVVVFSLSYTFPNYWPWYNHTVIVYELIALAFLFRSLFGPNRHSEWWVIPSGIFIFFSFFTKQDGGGLAFLLAIALLIYHCYGEKKWNALIYFIGSVILTGLVMILPFLPHGFGYWFNHGQPPHSSRISVSDIIGEFLSGSQWIKFYIVLILLLFFAQLRKNRDIIQQKQYLLLLLLTAGIVMEAVIFQVTSYVPVDNNIFFHSFCITCILYQLWQLEIFDAFSNKMILLTTAAVFFWWSQVYWKYVQRFILPDEKRGQATTEYKGYSYGNEVNRNTYIIPLDTTDIPLTRWRIPDAPSFKKILVPAPTADGIERLLKSPLVRNNKNLRVLNMSELTPLARDIPFSLEKGTHYPLWYHKGVALFDRETKMFVDRIEKNYYDLVLFEYIPYLNNFYPFTVRAALEKYYERIDVFPAPRKPSSDAWVEVYVKKR
ncbi:MAG TPA: hypothetical protein VM012_05930 [Flavitalea sp.]|nr:hypothetical protein [Flavitalea sp.]